MTNIVLLDGGMGQELLKRCKARPSPLWSAQVLLDEPHVVEDVHFDYIEAGASVITLNSYSATPERLEREGAGQLFVDLQMRAVEVASKARDRSGKDIRIAGCLPPLHASYRPDLNTDHDAMLESYSRLAQLQKDHVDVFLCETLASVAEIAAAGKAATDTGKPVWMGMTAKDGAVSTLRSGEPLSAGVDAAVNAGVQAVLINCSMPETISGGMADLKEAGLPFGAYANGFTSIDALKPGGTVDVLEARADLGPEAYADFAMQWVDQGAAIIGGCCEVGPAHIAFLHRKLIEAGHSIVGELDG